MVKKKPIRAAPKAVGLLPRKTVSAVAERPGAKKASAKLKPRIAYAQQSKARVTYADVGGYRVYTTPIRPEHFTEEQIQDAIASLR